MNQTLEQAAFSYMKSEIKDWLDNIYLEGQNFTLEKGIQQAFKAGAKYQEEKEKIVSSCLKKAANEFLEKHPSDYIGEVHTEEAFLSGAEWQKEQSPWISVEDKLPEEKQLVLVANYFKSARKPYYEYYMGFYQDGEWCACTCVDENGEDYILTDVTYWMPIPELPKGGGE